MEMNAITLMLAGLIIASLMVGSVIGGCVVLMRE